MKTWKYKSVLHKVFEVTPNKNHIDYGKKFYYMSVIGWNEDSEQPKDVIELVSLRAAVEGKNIVFVEEYRFDDLKNDKEVNELAKHCLDILEAHVSVCVLEELE